MKNGRLSRIAAAFLAAVMLMSQAAFLFAEEADVAVPDVADTQPGIVTEEPVLEEPIAEVPVEEDTTQIQEPAAEEPATSEVADDITIVDEVAPDEVDVIEADDAISEEIENSVDEGITAGYDQKDMFAANGSLLKGSQQAPFTAVYNCRHAFLNFEIEKCFDASRSGEPRIYKGKEYYFDYGYIGGIIANIAARRNEGMSVSVAFLLKWDDNLSYLIDEGSRQPGHKYYAPATTGEGGEAMEAFWSEILELCAANETAIDNFILGNEVNDPERWHWSGADIYASIDKYAAAFKTMYNQVRKYTSVSRCSMSLDHNWAWNDNGREIPGKVFIDQFSAKVGSDVDWSISYHLYPGFMGDTRMWTYRGYTPNDNSAHFIDGMNLNVLTDYVKNTYGEQHRIMLTEQGFSRQMDHDNQVAAMAISYYAAKYNSMVDCFIMNCEASSNPVENFYLYEARELGITPISGHADEWTDLIRLDSGKPEDQAYFEDTVQRMSGMSLAQIVPNYGKEVTRHTTLPPADPEKIGQFVERLYTTALGRASEPSGKAAWTNYLVARKATGAEAGKAFMLGKEFENRHLSDDAFLNVVYQTYFGRSPDAGGYNAWLKFLQNGYSREGVICAFAVSKEFQQICDNYGMVRGTITSSQNRDKNGTLTSFVNRIYTKLLDRDAEEKGLNDWTGAILKGDFTVKQTAVIFVESKEFLAHNYSTEDYVTHLYRMFFGREPEAAGFNTWVKYINAGKCTRTQAAEAFADGPEFAAIMKDAGV